MEYIIFLLCLLCIFLIYRDNKNMQTIKDITDISLKLKEENEKYEEVLKEWNKKHRLF